MFREQQVGWLPVLSSCCCLASPAPASDRLLLAGGSFNATSSRNNVQYIHFRRGMVLSQRCTLLSTVLERVAVHVCPACNTPLALTGLIANAVYQ
jgi:hypothetical protein